LGHYHFRLVHKCRAFLFMGRKKVISDEGKKINEQQELFCQLYAYGQNRGNGVLCYAEAYKIDLSEKGAYMSAKTGAWRLLTNDDILTYIRGLYESNDLNDTVVDNELAFVIKQNADFGSKVAAIKEYNALKTRIKARADDGLTLNVIIKKGGNDAGGKH